MKHSSLLVTLTALLVFGLVLSACAPAATQAPAATEASAAACDGDYVLVPKNLGNPYFRQRVEQEKTLLYAA